VVVTAAAVVVVAAEKSTNLSSIPVRPGTPSAPVETGAPSAAPHPERPAVLAEGTQTDAPAFRPAVAPELSARATLIGNTWCSEYVRDLRAQARDIVGGWPGTLREARRRVLAAMPRNLDPLLLDELARLANLAARRGWESISEPDLEP
jgi:hypothetical protein